MMRSVLKVFGYIFLVFIALSCEEKQSKRFHSVDSVDSGVTFSNRLTESDSLNYFKYPYLYMGGGVAISDFDNDGLQDLFFTGNMVDNKLYHNKGNFVFEDISTVASVNGSTSKWYTGVAIVDLNQDGFNDIYLSVAGLNSDRSNELYINNQDLTFTESAQKYSLADSGYSVQTSFFDYDHDGDLDVYVVNYPMTSFATSNFTYKFNVDRPKHEKSDHLYENLGGGKFEDVTVKSSLLSFGLSLSASIVDFNNDGWEDIYVSNDFSTPDFFYINNGDGTFTDQLKEITNQTAFYGMGTDAADINNDGLIDLIQVDMSAADNRRAKANMASMNPTLFWSTVNSGFHYQYMYNALQINQGIVDGLPRMSNIARIAGVSSTDWSWTPLLADFDNDGFKDLFVANGTRKEINNRDYFVPLENKLDKVSDAELKKISDDIPSEPIDNYMFKNELGKGFVKVNEDWGVSHVGFSNGAAYGDLDNDGDLDLVVNNLDSVASIYQNQNEQFDKTNYLRLNITKSGVTALGAQVEVFGKGLYQKGQLQNVRGFQSTVEPYLHFGLGGLKVTDSVKVMYQGSLFCVLKNIQVNQLLELNLDEYTAISEPSNIEKETFFRVQPLNDERTFVHMENRFDDFRHQVLLPHKMSNFGPALTTGDVNGDGLDDVIIGGAAGVQAQLLIQNNEGRFEKKNFQEQEDLLHEDIDAKLLDLDGDGDLDLYMVSGGNEFDKGSDEYQDRIYENVDGELLLSQGVLPILLGSGSVIKPFDYDKDGDLDLFIGGRLSPRNYPMPGESYLLENVTDNGVMKFENVTSHVAPDLNLTGMVTDALWTDVNQDGSIDLVVVGEWMPIKSFLNINGKFEEKNFAPGDEHSTGWWFSIEEGDFDNDGDMDYVTGNLGLNYKYQAKKEETFDLYVSDFDKNDKTDIVLSYHNFGKEYPVRGRQCSSEQIPAIKVAYKNYDSFSTASMQDIFGDEMLNEAIHFSVEDFSSTLWIRQDDGSFTKKSLPWEAQWNPINDFLVDDFNGDGNLDIVLVGNLFASEVETPRADAGMGMFLLGDGNNEFKPVSLEKSGLLIRHDTKGVEPIQVLGEEGFVVVNNQGPVQLFMRNK